MIDEKICPLCNKPNGCDGSSDKCWCYSVEIPKKILDKIPEEKRGKACVCKDCIEKYRED